MAGLTQPAPQSPEGKLIKWLRDREGRAGLFYDHERVVELTAGQLRTLNHLISTYESTICWGVDCVHQASCLDTAISEYERGHHSGLVHAAALVQDYDRRHPIRTHGYPDADAILRLIHDHKTCTHPNCTD